MTLPNFGRCARRSHSFAQNFSRRGWFRWRHDTALRNMRFLRPIPEALLNAFAQPRSLHAFEVKARSADRLEHTTEIRSLVAPLADEKIVRAPFDIRDFDAAPATVVPRA